MDHGQCSIQLRTKICIFSSKTHIHTYTNTRTQTRNRRHFVPLLVTNFYKACIAFYQLGLGFVNEDLFF